MASPVILLANSSAATIKSKRNLHNAPLRRKMQDGHAMAFRRPVGASWRQPVIG
jgi:hypothetical protein